MYDAKRLQVQDLWINGRLRLIALLDMEVRWQQEMRAKYWNPAVQAWLGECFH
jgi:hypothetical protein